MDKLNEFEEQYHACCIAVLNSDLSLRQSRRKLARFTLRWKHKRRLRNCPRLPLVPDGVFFVERLNNWKRTP